LYYWTDSGWNVSPDTVEYAKLMVLDTTSIVMSLPGLVFDPIGKYLFDLTTSTGQRDFIGGENMVFLADSIIIVDTIGGVAVTNMQEAVNALEILTSNTIYSANGAIPASTARVATIPANSSLGLQMVGGHEYKFDATAALFRNPNAAAPAAQQISPGTIWEGNGWKTNGPAASQAVAFRANVTPAQGEIRPSGRWGLAASVNGGAYLADIISATSDGTEAGTTVNIGSFNAGVGTVNIGATEGSVLFINGYNNTFFKNRLTFYTGGDQSSLQGFSGLNVGLAMGYAQTGTNPGGAKTTLTIKGATSDTLGTVLRLRNAADTEILTARNDNRVGINQTAPQATLDVGGNVRIAAGTTLVAPLQLTAGTNLTTPKNGAVEFDGTNYFVTTSGTRHILSKTLTGTGVLNYGSIASLATETLTITVTGAAIGDVILVGIDNGSKSTGLIFGQPWVSGTNTVSLEAYNSTVSPIDPASGTFRASVIKY